MQNWNLTGHSVPFWIVLMMDLLMESACSQVLVKIIEHFTVCDSCLIKRHFLFL